MLLRKGGEAPKPHAVQARSGQEIVLRSGVSDYDGTAIVLDSVQDVVVRGYPDTILRISGTGPVVMVTGSCANIRFDGFTIQGPGPLREPNKVYSALVSLNGPYDGLDFCDVHLLNGPNHGIADLASRIGRNVSFRRCTARNGGNYGRTDGLKWDETKDESRR